MRDSHERGSQGNKLRMAFQLAVDAFLWFDVDGNGLINRCVSGP